MQLEIFKYQSPEESSFQDIRTVEIDGEIWFVGADVARVLGYQRPSEAIARHCKEKGTLNQRIPTQGGEQQMIIINEPNLYRLIVKSQLESAERFESWIFEEVLPSIRKRGFYGKIDRTAVPNFYTRYIDNLHKIPIHKYFSVISELFIVLFSELEKVGYVIPDKAEDGRGMYPDISVGMTFANYLQRIGSEYQDQFQRYPHSFPDGRPDVDAKMYPVEALPLFRKFVIEVWIPQNATTYFRQRDPLALDYLPKLLGART
jgi:prophage antirepressor-like protein